MITLLATLLTLLPAQRAPMSVYESDGVQIAACAEYFRTGDETAIAVDVGAGVVGTLECEDYRDAVKDEPAFRSWYAKTAKRWHLSADPDDARHGYDYRAYWQALRRGKAARITREGLFPEEFKRVMRYGYDSDHCQR